MSGDMRMQFSISRLDVCFTNGNAGEDIGAPVSRVAIFIDRYLKKICNQHRRSLLFAPASQNVSATPDRLSNAADIGSTACVLIHLDLSRAVPAGSLPGICFGGILESRNG